MLGCIEHLLREPPTLPTLRTDVRRALALLAEGRWVRERPAYDGRATAEVQLSKYPGDAVPIGLDVLALLTAAGYVAPGRTLPRGDRRHNLTTAGLAALAAPDPALVPGVDVRPSA
jgi:hypothetical protein